MGEIKIFGYILVAVLFLSAILMPLTDVFFAYRERLMLSDALYNSCRAATEAGYNMVNLRIIDAKRYNEYFLEAFENSFATSFDLALSETISTTNGYTLKFIPNNDAYNNFEVKLNFNEEESYDPYTDDKKITSVTASATSPYKFKIAYMQRLNDSGNVEYTLKSERTYIMEVFN